MAFESFFRGQATEFDERRVNIEQLGGTSAGGRFDYAWSAEDERHTSRAFPKRILACDAFFSEMPAMVGPEDDKRVRFVAGRFECVEDAPDLAVHETGAS